ncbi:MAG: 4Fe-4S dicluster domain-containing protein [Thermodesulfovibrionales bacterium]|nr:4Fe-4S dicluster domain-containing protein [Thermodesulfovibrionales bacterium]
MNLKRRDFIKLLLAGGAVLIAGRLTVLNRAAENEKEGPLPHIDVGGLIRPPGAVPEKWFRSKCIGCGVCVNVCHVMKYDAIALAGIWNIRNFGTPFLKDMRDFPCGLCMECPKKCPTGALRPLKKEEVRMGMALIDFSLCFGWNGDVCLSCSKACPLGAQVFEFYNSEWGNQPYINEKCAGCGLCVKYCPLGGSAIKVIKREKYSEIMGRYIDEFRRLLYMPAQERYSIVYNENLPKIMERGRLTEREYR